MADSLAFDGLYAVAAIANACGLLPQSSLLATKLPEPSCNSSTGSEGVPTGIYLPDLRPNLPVVVRRDHSAPRVVQLKHRIRQHIYHAETAKRRPENTDKHGFRLRSADNETADHYVISSTDVHSG